MTINSVTLWCDSKDFTFSSAKTKTMFLRNKCGQIGVSLTLTLNDSPIGLKSQVKLLGILFDDHLTYLTHILILKTHCYRFWTSYVTSHLHITVQTGRLLLFFIALARSRLDYGFVIYEQTSKSYLRPLDPIQNGAKRAFRSSPK